MGCCWLCALSHTEIVMLSSFLFLPPFLCMGDSIAIKIWTFQPIRHFQLNCTQPSRGMICKGVVRTDMSPLFQACCSFYALNSVTTKCVKSLGIIVYITKDYSWVNPVKLLQVFNFLTSPLRSEITAVCNSSLRIVMSLVGATLAFPITSEQLICPVLLIALRYEHAHIQLN